MSYLRLEEIGKTFTHSVKVLENVTLSVNAGEYLALVGPSGGGKTTLLRLIAGLEAPSSGNIFIGGQCVKSTPPHQRGVAMFFQRPALMLQQTVQQNLNWARTLLHRTTPPAHELLLRVARILGLETDLDRLVHQLSGGQQQRVALGRCLLLEAPLCLLDEPLGHLDAPLRTDLRRQIRALTRELGGTTIHVTHDPEEALAVGDRVAVLHEGLLVQVDRPLAVRPAPATRYVAELIHHQTGGMNFTAGEIRREGMDTYFECPFGRLPMSVRIVDDLRESLCEGENFHPGEGKVHIIMGVAVADVQATTAADLDVESMRFVTPIGELESCDQATRVVGIDGRGQWVGHASLDERLERGQKVTMMFSMSRAYWFDATTGRTLALPAG